jgi:hypothetical protein
LPERLVRGRHLHGEQRHVSMTRVAVFLLTFGRGSLRVFNCRIKDRGMIGSLGDLEHMRSFVEHACGASRRRMVGKGEIVWLTDSTPHEAVPLDAAVKRQFVRVVTSSLTVWHAAHCTPNPLGIVPGPDVRITTENKFVVAAVEPTEP